MLAPGEVAAARKSLGLSQGALARLAGVSQSFVAKVERGRIDPAYSKLRALSDALERAAGNGQGKA